MLKGGSTCTAQLSVIGNGCRVWGHAPVERSRRLRLLVSTQGPVTSPVDCRLKARTECDSQRRRRQVGPGPTHHHPSAVRGPDPHCTHILPASERQPQVVAGRCTPPCWLCECVPSFADVIHSPERANCLKEPYNRATDGADR